MIRNVWLLMVAAACVTGSETAESVLNRLSQQCFPASGAAAVPRLGTWCPDGDGQWHVIEEQRRTRPTWPRDEALQRRMDVVDGALHGSGIHTIDEWLALLPATPDRLDFSRLLIADGRWRDAVGVLNRFSQTHIVADGRYRALWRESWAALLDLQAAAASMPGLVLDPPVVVVPTWDRGFPAWYASRIQPPMVESAGQWSCAAQAEITRGAEVQITHDQATLLVAPLRPGHLRWTWRAIADEATLFDVRWCDAPVIASGESSDSSAQVVKIPATEAKNLVLMAELDDGVTIAWAVVHPLPIQLHAWSDGSVLTVTAADTRGDGLISCPPLTITCAGKPVLGGHLDGMMWVQSLADQPTGARLEISAGESSCSLVRPEIPAVPWRLATWWSKAHVEPGEKISLAGCVRLSEWTKTRPVEGSGGRIAMRLEKAKDSTDMLDLGAIEVDSQGCFTLSFIVPNWFTSYPTLSIGSQHFQVSAPTSMEEPMLELEVNDEIIPGRYAPPLVQWQPAAEPVWYPWRDDYNFIPGAKSPVREQLAGAACRRMRSDGTTTMVENLPGVPDLAPAAPEGLWHWHWAGFKSGQWHSAEATSWVRPPATTLQCTVTASAERVTVRITDQNHRPVNGAMVTLRVTEDSDANAINDTDAFSTLFSGARQSMMSSDSRITARCSSGVVWRTLRSSTYIHRHMPEVGDFYLGHFPVRFGRGRCCGGCRGRGIGSPLKAVDPLALWRPWVRTSDDGIINETFSWPTPFPDALKITVIAISGDQIGQVSGSLRGDWTPPN